MGVGYVDNISLSVIAEFLRIWELLLLCFLMQDVPDSFS